MNIREGFSTNKLKSLFLFYKHFFGKRRIFREDSVFYYISSDTLIELYLFNFAETQIKAIVCTKHGSPKGFEYNEGQFFV